VLPSDKYPPRGRPLAHARYADRSPWSIKTELFLVKCPQVLSPHSKGSTGHCTDGTLLVCVLVSNSNRMRSDRQGAEFLDSPTDTSMAALRNISSSHLEFI
jgi:hypothetical protein